MYFSKFPVVNYPIKINEQFRTVLARNILRRIVLSDDLKSSGSAFIEYSVKDGERPEHIADKLYGNPELHWIVLLTNDIIDPYYDWCKSDAAIEQYIQKKYSDYSVYFTDPNDSLLYSGEIGAGATLMQGKIESKINSYDPNMCRITVGSSEFSNSYFVPTSPFSEREGSAKIIGVSGSTINIKIHRIDPSYTTAHHFEADGPLQEDGTLSKIWLDPFYQYGYGTTYSYTNGSLGMTQSTNATLATDVSNGYRSTLAVINTGEIRGWGSDVVNNGGIYSLGGSVLSYPRTITNAKKVFAGYYSGGVVYNDDTIAMWGLNNYGQSTPPTGLTGVNQLACCWENTAALLKDGRGITSWGSNGYSQNIIPANTSTTIQISGQGYHYAALKGDGSVVCWGRNSEGQCNVPSFPSGVTATKVAAGHLHTCALLTNGTVVCWGSNTSGQTTVPASAVNVVDVVAGYKNTIVMLSDGTVFSWGGNGPSDLISVKLDPTKVSKMTAVGNHLSVLFTDGSIRSFGLNDSGQANSQITTNVDMNETLIGRYMGILVTPDNSFAISNRDYELKKNEGMRTIKLLHPRFKDRAIQELENLLRV